MKLHPRALLVLLLCCIAVCIQARERYFYADLDGQQASKVNNFKGRLELIHNPAEGYFHFTLTHNVTDANDAHIHQGAVGTVSDKLFLFPTFISPVIGSANHSSLSLTFLELLYQTVSHT